MEATGILVHNTLEKQELEGLEWIKFKSVNVAPPQYMKKISLYISNIELDVPDFFAEIQDLKNIKIIERKANIE